MLRACLALVLFTLGSGCSCDEESALAVSGPVPFVRCHAAPGPEERTWRLGDLRLHTDGQRALRIEGLPSSSAEPLRLVVFAGPVLGDLGAVEALDPHLVAVLGDLGPDPAGALESLGRLSVPSLVVAGGADEFASLRSAFEAREEEDGEAPRVLNASVLRSIRVGALELVPVAGAPDGRYALGEGACGIAGEDAGDWALEEPEEGVHRVLLTWAGTAGDGPSSVTRGLARVEAGSPLLSRIARAASARGEIFAWPRTNAGRSDVGGERSPGPAWNLRLAVPPLSGPAVVRADGTRVRPGPTLVLVGPEGLERTSPDFP